MKRPSIQIWISMFFYLPLLFHLARIISKDIPGCLAMQQRWIETPSQYYRRILRHPKPEEPHIRIQVCSSKNCTSLIIVFFFRTSKARQLLLRDTRTCNCMRLWILHQGSISIELLTCVLVCDPPGSWQWWREWSILCPDRSTQQPIRSFLVPLSAHM